MSRTEALTRERLLTILSDYFNIGDSYTYELTRTKEAFAMGTMSFDDFREWDEGNIADLCDYILKWQAVPLPQKENLEVK